MTEVAKRVVGWVEPAENELVQFHGESLEDARTAWTQLDEAEEALQWRRGAVAVWVSEHRVYGESNLEQFAHSMGLSYNTVAQYALVHRRVARLGIFARAKILSLEGLSWTHFRVCAAIEDDEEYVGLLLQAHDRGWSKARLSEQVAMQRSLREQSEQLVMDGPEHEEGPPVEETEAGEPPPEVRHPVLGRIGYLRPEVRDTMAQKLDAMDEAEREEAYERLGGFDPIFTRALAGLPTPEDVRDGEDGGEEAEDGEIVYDGDYFVEPGRLSEARRALEDARIVGGKIAEGEEMAVMYEVEIIRGYIEQLEETLKEVASE